MADGLSRQNRDGQRNGWRSRFWNELKLGILEIVAVGVVTGFYDGSLERFMLKYEMQIPEEQELSDNVKNSERRDAWSTVRASHITTSRT